jgi:hypothetical protein
MPSLLLLGLAVAGCNAGDPGVIMGAGGQGGANADSGAAITTSGIPCDVASVLTNHCLQCHGAPPIAGVPVSLTTYDALHGPSPLYPGETNAQRAITRMQATANPMPPAPASAVPASEIAIVQAWVQGGYQQGSCSQPADGGADPYGTPSTCTSGKTWTGGTRGSPSMTPGQACIACHTTQQGEAPLFSIAGTVYPTAHEPADCNGASGTGVTVVIQPAQGAAITLVPNAVGNFSYQGSIALPYQAKVVSGGRERVMAMAQTTGDCNSCHTETGANLAPGRIMLP